MASGQVSSGGRGRITGLTMTPGTFRIAVSELHHPWWKAWIDDAEVPVRRVDYVGMGVSVPSGQHRVRLAFEPGSLRLGAGVSAAGAVALILYLLAPLRRRRTEGSGTGARA